MENNNSYLINIANRVTEFRKTREQVVKYILKNSISNEGLISQLIVMAFVWKSYKLGEEYLKESDISIFLQDISFKPMDIFVPEKTYVLHPMHHNIDLNGLLDETVKHYQKKENNIE